MDSELGPLQSRWFRNDQPLWLPPGTIRALLTFTLVAALAALYLVHRWAPPELVALTIAVVRDYFQFKLDEFKTEEGSNR